MTAVLTAAAAHARRYVETVGERPVRPAASLDELRARLDRPLPDGGMPDAAVVDALVAEAGDGILHSTSGRFFGWVIGGTLPVALAADWLTAAWDQNAASNVTAPAEAVVEEVTGRWLKQLLGLPEAASFAFVTGCQMAHTAALAAARHALLRARDWDVEAQGLAGAPPLRVLTSDHRHESILRAVRLLGIGTDAMRIVSGDAMGRIDCAALAEALSADDRPTVVCLQAGDLNTGRFDDFATAVPLARRHGAWVHVDGAFGLWAAASPRFRHLLDGVDGAQSWATDGHKWLNLPFDSGFVFVADAAAHRAAFAQDTSYAVPVETLRNQKDWNPEWSRRGRGFPAYAAIRALGRAGIAALVERCCDHAARLVAGIGALDGAEVIAAPVINQGLVRFRAADGDHGRRTEAVVRRIQAGGEAWFGTALWRNMRVMRVSVCNHATTERDVDRAVAAVAAALAETPA